MRPISKNKLLSDLVNQIANEEEMVRQITEDFLKLRMPGTDTNIVHITRSAYDALSIKKNDIIYIIAEFDGTYTFKLGEQGYGPWQKADYAATYILGEVGEHGYAYPINLGKVGLSGMASPIAEGNVGLTGTTYPITNGGHGVSGPAVFHQI